MGPCDQGGIEKKVKSGKRGGGRRRHNARSREGGGGGGVEIFISRPTERTCKATDCTAVCTVLYCTVEFNATTRNKTGQRNEVRPSEPPPSRHPIDAKTHYTQDTGKWIELHSLYLKVFRLSNLTRSMRSSVCWNCSSVSPGKPTMTSPVMAASGALW